MDIGFLGQSHPRQQRASTLQRLDPRLLLHIDRSLDDVLQRGAMREQVEALEHHRDSRPDRDDRGRIAIHPRAFDKNIAAVIAFQSVDTAQDGGFSRARGTDDADHLALLDRRRDALQHLDLAKTLVNVGELDHFWPARFSKWRTRRMSGMLMVRYIRATSVNTLVFLKVEDAISLPCSASSATVMVEACDESFSSMIMMLPEGGSTMRTACGSTTRRMV